MKTLFCLQKVHFDSCLSRHYTSFCCFLIHSEQMKRNPGSSAGETTTHIPGLLAPLRVCESEHPRCFPSHPLARALLAPAALRNPGRASLPPSAQRRFPAKDLAPHELPAEPRQNGHAPWTKNLREATERGLRCPARLCEGTRGGQGPQWGRWQGQGFVPLSSEALHRDTAGLWYMCFINVQSESYPEALSVAGRPNPSRRVVFFSAHRDWGDHSLVAALTH